MLSDISMDSDDDDGDNDVDEVDDRSHNDDD